MRRPPVLVAPLLALLVVAVLAASALLGRAPLPAAEAAASSIGASAFARVSAAGALDATRSVNVLSVTRPSTGLYCLDLDVPVPVRNAVASLNAASAPRVVAASVAALDGPAATAAADAGCRPPTTDVVVIAYNLAGARANASFYVLMH